MNLLDRQRAESTGLPGALTAEAGLARLRIAAMPGSSQGAGPGAEARRLRLSVSVSQQPGTTRAASRRPRRGMPG